MSKLSIARGKSGLTEVREPTRVKVLLFLRFKMKEKILTLEEHYNLKNNRILSLKDNIYIVSLKNKDILIQRIGKCEPKECKSACCKFIHIESDNSYYQGFGEKTREGIRINKVCKHLCKLKCSLWKKKSFPEACQQFPNPTDTVFNEVYGVCSFRFAIIGEMKK